MYNVDNFTEEELHRLTSLLLESKSARTRYSELTIQDSLLHWESVDYLETANSGNGRSSIITLKVEVMLFSLLLDYQILLEDYLLKVLLMQHSFQVMRLNFLKEKIVLKNLQLMFLIY